MKILLFGKTGQLGWELQRTLAPLGNVLAYGPKEQDITDLQELERLIKDIRPDVLINASGYTAVDQAEEEVELAMLLNVKVPAIMAEVTRSLNSIMIHYSTDYVFDGTKGSAYVEDDATNPLNVYGRSKLEGERAIQQAGDKQIILRTSWLYGLYRSNFLTKALAWSKRQETMHIVSDQVGSPTSARMLAEVTSLLIARAFPNPHDFFSEKTGIYHLAGSGAVSRFGFVKEVLSLDPHPEEQKVKVLAPALTKDFPLQARRPLVTPLDCSHFERIFGLNLPPWEGALRLAMGN